MNDRKHERNQTILDKVIYILAGVTTLVLFLIDLWSNILALSTVWQILLPLISALSFFFTVLSFVFNHKFIEHEERISKKILSDAEVKANDILVKFSQIHDLFELVSSKNEEIKEYAENRINEFLKKLNKSINAGESDILNSEEYYRKLDQLADKIEADKKLYNSLGAKVKHTKLEPMIWALTCFNGGEWDNTGEEDKWSDRLEKLSRNDKIKVERVCIISQTIQDFISLTDNKKITIYEQDENVYSFINFLSRYYYKGKEVKNTTHYAFVTDSTSKLEETKGFFGVCLSNGEKHIVKGDCFANGSTAKIVFDCEDLFNEFSLKKVHGNLELKSYIRRYAGSAFKSYLENRNISVLR